MNNEYREMINEINKWMTGRERKLIIDKLKNHTWNE